MTKILICDDEGIVRESLQFIIEKNFKEEIQIECARNGRIAIELAEEFRPDIIIMDIQMPGINGIEAMREIRKENKNVVFIVLTAYDKFEYSQVSIDLGVYCYLTKPINKDKFCEVLRKAKAKIKERKQKVRSDLLIKEKLEAVIPIIETGFVYSTIFEKTDDEESNYRELLSIKEEYGYTMVIECGDEIRQGILHNKVGAGIKLQKESAIFRETIKELVYSMVGEVMANKVIVVVPCEKERECYDERVQKIESMRAILRKLEGQIGIKFKVGIGTAKKWCRMSESYREANEALVQGIGKVAHVEDMPGGCLYEETYPYELENKLFDALGKGEQERTEHYSTVFVQWMESEFPQLNDSIRLKTIEFVLRAEQMAYLQGGMVYRFSDRADYLSMVYSLDSYRSLTKWFVQKMVDAATHVGLRQHEKTGSVVEKAKEYISQNFKLELSLENIAQKVGISPYYLSKIFKELEGVNYIEYVTRLRMEYAKEALLKGEDSIKTICCDAGYSDPNYFSRIFKKWVGMTPTDYREKGGLV
ncbi:response regulator [Lachnospiraceae bacterium OttesenSCG-928-E19]|nr:response regulator [Lachnospiraceae bacterium OttesenSCG-928-E19]